MELSENESSLFSFRIGRENVNEFEVLKFKKRVLLGKFDLCRLKLPAEDEMISIKLHQTGFPFYFSGSIRRYETPILVRPEGNFLHPEMAYEVYDGSQKDLLLTMLKGTWGTYPLGYYRTPFLADLVDKEKEIQAVFNFYKKSNLNSLNPDNSILFMKDGDNYVGFFALNKIDGHLESHIGGILKPYRRGGYFLDMQRYIKNYCLDNHLSHFAFGARNENAEVQRIFQYENYLPVGSENVFHVLSMLSLNQLDKEVKIGQSHYQSLYDLLPDIKNQLSHLFPSFSIKKIQTADFSSQLSDRVFLSVPVKTDEHALIVLKEYNRNEELVRCHYLELA